MSKQQGTTWNGAKPQGTCWGPRCVATYAAISRVASSQYFAGGANAGLAPPGPNSPAIPCEKKKTPRCRHASPSKHPPILVEITLIQVWSRTCYSFKCMLPLPPKSSGSPASPKTGMGCGCTPVSVIELLWAAHFQNCVVALGCVREFKWLDWDKRQVALHGSSVIQTLSSKKNFPTGTDVIGQSVFNPHHCWAAPGSLQRRQWRHTHFEARGGGQRRPTTLLGNGTGGKASGPGKGTGRRNASGVAVGRGGVRSGVGCWGWGRGRRPRGVGLWRAEELRQLGLQDACAEPAGRCVNKGTVHEVPQTEKKNFGNCWEQQLPKRPPFLLLFAPPGTGGGVTYIFPRTSHSPPSSQGEGRLAVPGSRVTRNAEKRPKCFLTFGAGSLWWFFTDCTERSLGQD